MFFKGRIVEKIFSYIVKVREVFNYRSYEYKLL